MLGKLLLSSIAVQVSLACITLEKVNNGEQGLRHGGDMSDPPMPGCNRLSCGMSSKPEKRLKVSVDQGLRIEHKIHEIYKGGQVRYQIKWGEHPDFDSSPGFELEEDDHLYITSGMSTLKKSLLLEPGYNGNATIQVMYQTSGLEIKLQDMTLPNVRSEFVQCIDLELVEGMDIPEGDWAGGFGPTAVPDDGTGADAKGAGLPDVGNPFTTIALILSFLIVIYVALAIFFWWQNRTYQPMKDQDPIVQENVIEPPPPPIAKEEKSSTPEEEVEPVVGVHYESPEPTPEKPANLEKTGSMGRHFHFRYVEDDDN